MSCQEIKSQHTNVQIQQVIKARLWGRCSGASDFLGACGALTLKKQLHISYRYREMNSAWKFDIDTENGHCYLLHLIVWCVNSRDCRFMTIFLTFVMKLHVIWTLYPRGRCPGTSEAHNPSLLVSEGNNNVLQLVHTIEAAIKCSEDTINT